jgi:hypothetical protein
MSARSNDSNLIKDFPRTEFEKLAQLRRQNHRVQRNKPISIQVYSDDEIAIIRLIIGLVSFLLLLLLFILGIALYEGNKTLEAEHLSNLKCRFEVGCPFIRHIFAYST